MSAPEVDRKAERWGAIGPCEAGRQIAIRLAEAGQLERAAKIADPNDQARAIRDVVLVHLRTAGPGPAKRLEDLCSTIAKISRQPAIVAELATEIVIWLAEQGDKDGALEILAKAEQFAAYIRDEGQKGKALAFIASEYIELGEVDRARRLIDQIEDEFWRAVVLGMISTLLAEAGDFAGAEAVAAAIDDQEKVERNGAYARLAGSLAVAGQLDEARRVVGRITSATWKVSALAFGMVDPKDQAQAISSLAIRYAEAGQFDDVDGLAARPIATGASASMISDGLEDFARSLREAEEAAAATRHIKEAERFAALIEDPEKEFSRYLGFARAYIAFGLQVDAERVAAGIEDARERVFALEDLVVALAGVGQAGEAVRIAGLVARIEGAEEWRGSGLSQVAEALAVAGEMAKAEAVADGIVKALPRAEALGAGCASFG